MKLMLNGGEPSYLFFLSGLFVFYSKSRLDAQLGRWQTICPFCIISFASHVPANYLSILETQPRSIACKICGRLLKF